MGAGRFPAHPDTTLSTERRSVAETSSQIAIPAALRRGFGFADGAVRCALSSVRSGSRSNSKSTAPELGLWGTSWAAPVMDLVRVAHMVRRPHLSGRPLALVVAAIAAAVLRGSSARHRSRRSQVASGDRPSWRSRSPRPIVSGTVVGRPWARKLSLAADYSAVLSRTDGRRRRRLEDHILGQERGGVQVLATANGIPLFTILADECGTAASGSTW